MTFSAVQEPGILVVVPTLDSYRLLPRLVASLQAQSSSAWRVLFIDGASGSEHRGWLETLCERDGRFEWQAQAPGRSGIFGAMNQGFAAAEPHEWLLFWGSDDWAAAPDVIARALSALSPSADLLVCRARYVASAPGTDGKACPGRPSVFRTGGSLRRSLWLGSTPPHQATLIGPGARLHLEGYRESLRLAADLDYFLRLSACPSLRLRVLDLELVFMLEGGVSGVQHARRLSEVRRAYREAFGRLWWFPFLMRYIRRVTSLVIPR